MVLRDDELRGFYEAEEPGIAQLERTIALLEDRVRRLENRVEELEADYYDEAHEDGQ